MSNSIDNSISCNTLNRVVWCHLVISYPFFVLLCCAMLCFIFAPILSKRRASYSKALNYVVVGWASASWHGPTVLAFKLWNCLTTVCTKFVLASPVCFVYFPYNAFIDLAMWSDLVGTCNEANTYQGHLSHITRGSCTCVNWPQHCEKKQTKSL